MITMTEHTFLAAQHHLNTATHRPGTAATKAGELSQKVGDFPLIRAQDGPLLPPAALGKLLCGSAVGRLVVTATGVPLNAGRTQRTFKNTLRRAVELRDQHCTWPTCTQIARYCEVHHLDHWDTDHGHTDVARGVLLCTFHHHELHTHDLDLVPAPPDETTDPPRLPGDADYQPPRYELVPRARTADDRRRRLLQRARQGDTARREDPNTSHGPDERRTA